MEDNTVQQPVDQPTPITTDSQPPVAQPGPATPQIPEPITPTEIGSAFSLFNPSIAALKLNLKAYLGVYGVIVLMGIIVGIMSAAGGSIETNGQVVAGAQTALNATALILGLFIVVLSLILGPAITYVQVQSAKGIRVSLGDALRTGAKFILRYIGLNILVSLLIMGGLLLFVIHGIIMIRRYFLSANVMIDKNVGILEAMRQSAALSKPHSGKIWGIVGVYILTYLPSFVPIIGSIVSAVLQFLYSFAPAIRYVQLDNAAKVSVAAGEPIPNPTGN